MASPKPEEQPVMSHVRGREGVVKLKGSLEMVGSAILKVDVEIKFSLDRRESKLLSYVFQHGHTKN